MTPVTLSQPVIFRPAPDDPFGPAPWVGIVDRYSPHDAWLKPEGESWPPAHGECEGDDPEAVDRHAADQLTLSIAQFYDTAWPLSPEPA